jgi:nickel-type superoxide dismutase maturation protease
MLRRIASLWPLARYRIEGESMAPTLASGERVLVNRAAYWFRPPRTDDLVVVRDPQAPDRFLLKRIAAPAGDDAWLVLGDNQRASRDSREFGPVTKGQIVGKVVLRY